MLVKLKAHMNMYKQTVRIQHSEKTETQCLKYERNAEEASELEFTSDLEEGADEASLEDSSGENEYVLTLDDEISSTTRSDLGQYPGESCQRNEILRAIDVTERSICRPTYQAHARNPPSSQDAKKRSITERKFVSFRSRKR